MKDTLGEYARLGRTPIEVAKGAFLDFYLGNHLEEGKSHLDFKINLDEKTVSTIAKLRDRALPEPYDAERWDLRITHAGDRRTPTKIKMSAGCGGFILPHDYGMRPAIIPGAFFLVFEPGEGFAVTWQKGRRFTLNLAMGFPGFAFQPGYEATAAFVDFQQWTCLGHVAIFTSPRYAKIPV